MNEMTSVRVEKNCFEEFRTTITMATELMNELKASEKSMEDSFEIFRGGFHRAFDFIKITKRIK